MYLLMILMYAKYQVLNIIILGTKPPITCHYKNYHGGVTRVGVKTPMIQKYIIKGHPKSTFQLI
jgi:hypothetical protein